MHVTRALRSPLLALLVILPALVLAPRQGGSANRETLSIAPLYQDTPVWCWAASGEMIFRHFGVPAVNPRYQCGIVAFLGAPYTSCMNNCASCQVPAHDISVIKNMLEQYPVFAANALGRRDGRPIRSELGGDLSAKQVQREIDAGRPILIGLSPSGASRAVPEHAAVIVGYREEGEDSGHETWVIVNDPFPYEAFLRGEQTPYERAGGKRERLGQYSVEIDDLRTKLGWTDSLYELEQDGGTSVASADDDDSGDDDDDSWSDDDDDGGSGGKKACKKRCKQEKKRCVEKARASARKCVDRIRNQPSVRQCGCPDWPAFNFGCQRVCQDAYEDSQGCVADSLIAEQECDERKDECKDDC